eukprot:TRINITY_DN12351_c0_g1_i1.p1 TRINITY_DN12351_c0_g1~~TRINITY_DN12351_c0_g1_i1.p1  ORF type:complete len:583 (-),score=41.05 TRINITY_DN12351_c0_g1_i1:320-2068(-)
MYSRALSSQPTDQTLSNEVAANWEWYKGWTWVPGQWQWQYDGEWKWVEGWTWSGGWTWVERRYWRDEYGTGEIEVSRPTRPGCDPVPWRINVIGYSFSSWVDDQQEEFHITAGSKQLDRAGLSHMSTRLHACDLNFFHRVLAAEGDVASLALSDMLHFENYVLNICNGSPLRQSDCERMVRCFPSWDNPLMIKCWFRLPHEAREHLWFDGNLLDVVVLQGNRAAARSLVESCLCSLSKELGRSLGACRFFGGTSLCTPEDLCTTGHPEPIERSSTTAREAVSHQFAVYGPLLLKCLKVPSIVSNVLAFFRPPCMDFTALRSCGHPECVFCTELAEVRSHGAPMSVDAWPSATIEDVSWSEPAAARDERLLQIQADTDWAEYIESSMRDQQVPTASVAEDEAPSGEALHLLTYRRCPHRFHAALDEGPALEECRRAMEGAGHPWRLFSGAHVFVHPDQYDVALAEVEQRGIQLCAHHVIVSASLEQSLSASLQDLPRRFGIRVRDRSGLGLVRQSANSDEVAVHETQEVWEEQEFAGYCEERTFLCNCTPLRNSGSVAQSTTEAHQGGLNPRRVCVDTSSDGA